MGAKSEEGGKQRGVFARACTVWPLVQLAETAPTPHPGSTTRDFQLGLRAERCAWSRHASAACMRAPTCTHAPQHLTARF